MHRPTRTERTRASALGGALLCTLLLVWASPARALETTVVPSVDGYLGAWLLAGPLSAKAARQPHRPALEPGGLPYRPVAHPDGALDVRAVLGKSARPGSHAALGGILRLAQDLDALLLVGADGPLAVLVDGKIVHERRTSHLRGEAWDVVPLHLGAGDHPIVLELGYQLPHWAVAVRLLDAEDLTAPRGARLVLPGLGEAHQQVLQRRLLDVSVALETTPDRFFPTVRIDALRGALDTGRAVRVTLRGDEGTRVLDAGDLPIGPRGVAPMTIRLVGLDAGRMRVQTRVGPLSEDHVLELSERVQHALSLAERARRRLGEAARQSVRDPLLEDTLAYLTATLRASDGSDGAHRDRQLEPLLRLSQKVLEGADPLAEPGVMEIALRSPLDGQLHPSLLHVPQGGSGRRPLVVALHGYRGSPEGILSAFLDTPGRSAHARVDGFVLAPEAFGDAFYRGPGEGSVLEALDAVAARYPIDPERVSITGVSMGGTGTAHIAFRHADRFSKAAPLAGYHSYFVRRDTRGKPRLPWETARMHHWSPASWAERGRSLPLHVAHGTRDYPLINSRVLTDRYRELGYALVDEWPDTGHSVWRVTYRGARLWPVLSSARRQRPARVTIVTDSLRYGGQHWAAITGLGSRTTLARLDAEERADGTVRVTTEGVTAFRLDPRASRTRLEVDGKPFDFDPHRPITAHARDGAWVPGEPPRRAGQKRPGLEGPIRDVFLHPVVFIYGARDPAERRANREAAEHFATRYAGSARYPIVADTEATAELLRDRSWFLVGSPDANAVLGRLEPRLPVRVREGALGMGGRTYRQPDVGALYIHPNPEQPDHYVVVLTAPEPAGIWRALSLPKLLPDYVLYDARVALATAEQILGEAPLIASGFFEDDWSLGPSAPAAAGGHSSRAGGIVHPRRSDSTERP